MKIGKIFGSCKVTLLTLGFLWNITAFPALAEESKASVVDIIPSHRATGEIKTPLEEDDTHPALRVMLDRSEIITLDRDAASVIVGNPLHANIVADSVRKLVVIPRAPGATYFTVLDKDGGVIMQRHVIVASPKEGYVRVKKVCNKDSGTGCKNTNVFYCPDMCHEIGSQTEGDSASASSASPSSGTSLNSGDGEQSSSEDASSEESTTQ